jgi:hypothetical protein
MRRAHISEAPWGRTDRRRHGACSRPTALSRRVRAHRRMSSILRARTHPSRSSDIWKAHCLLAIEWRVDCSISAAADKSSDSRTTFIVAPHRPPSGIELARAILRHRRTSPAFQASHSTARSQPAATIFRREWPRKEWTHNFARGAGYRKAANQAHPTTEAFALCGRSAAAPESRYAAGPHVKRL